MGNSTDNTLKIAIHFIDRYGLDKFQWLISNFLRGVSNAEIATDLNVSRQRVHQWKCTFMAETISVKPKIAELFQKKPA